MGIDESLLLLGNICEVGDHFLLDLKVDFKLDVLKFKDMVFDDDFEEVTVLFGTDSTVHLLSNLLSYLHALVQLQVGDLLFQEVFLAV